MNREYRISLTKKEWGFVLEALNEYIDKYGLDDPSVDTFDEEVDMVECSLNAREVITNKLEGI